MVFFLHAFKLPPHLLYLVTLNSFIHSLYILYVHTCTHMYTIHSPYTRVHVHVYCTLTCTCAHIHIYTCTCTCMYIHKVESKQVKWDGNTSEWTYMYTYMYMYVRTWDRKGLCMEIQSDYLTRRGFSQVC